MIFSRNITIIYPFVSPDIRSGIISKISLMISSLNPTRISVFIPCIQGRIILCFFFFMLLQATHGVTSSWGIFFKRIMSTLANIRKEPMFFVLPCMLENSFSVKYGTVSALLDTWKSPRWFFDIFAPTGQGDFFFTRANQKKIW